jgi:AsmA protein
MNRWLLRLGLLLAALAAAVLLGGLLAPRLVSHERMGRAVAIEISALTGQPVSTSGPARFSLLPWPTVTVADVEVGGEGGGPNLLQAAGLEARLGLLALLVGRTEVTGLELVRPRIALQVDAEGRANWRSGASLVSLLVAETPVSGERAARLGDLGIRDGQLTFRDDQAGRRTELSDIDLQLSWPSFTSRLSANGRFRLRGETIRFQGSVERPSALIMRDISPVELSFDTGAVRAQINGNALAGRELQVEGRLSFGSPSLRRLARWLAPEAQNAPDIGPVQGAARLKILDRAVTLEEARVTVDRARGEGALTVTFDPRRTSVQGTMDFDTIDARPFFAVELGPGSDRPLGGDSFGALDLDLRVSVASLQFGRTTVRSAALAFLSRDGRVEASLGDGRAFGGRVASRIVTERRPGGGVRMRGNASATAVQANDALRELFGVVRLAGTGDLSLTLAGEGGSMREVMAGLAGEATLRVTDGALAGIDLGTLVRRVERSPVEALLESRGGRSSIELASATFRIANGVAVTEDALVRGAGYRVTLRGQADLGGGNLAFNGVLGPGSAEAGRGPELPFVIRGPWTDPVLVPNPEGLIRRPVR